MGRGGKEGPVLNVYQPETLSSEPAECSLSKYEYKNVFFTLCMFGLGFVVNVMQFLQNLLSFYTSIV